MQGLASIRRIVSLVGLLGAIASIIAVCAHYWNPTPQDGRWGFVILGALAGVFLAFSAWQEYRFSRKARHAEASQFFQRAFQIALRDALDPPTNRDETIAKAEKFCDMLATAFTLTTATRCAVCIKVFDKTEDKYALVFALARDSNSQRRSQKTEDVKHWVNANTAFTYVSTSPTLDTFFAHNLPTRHNYKNTSCQVYGDPPDAPLVGWFLRRLKWPLPYKSTMVAAIVPPSATRFTEESLQGFLAVDSSSINAFSKRYDKYWLEAAAQMICPLVQQYYRLTREGEAT